MTRTVGIDVGGSFLKTVVVDGDAIGATTVSPVPESDLRSRVVAVARRLVAVEHPEAVGVVVAGLVTWPSGRFVWGPHVPERNLAERVELEELLGVPVAVDNDANAAALAELTAGAARGVRHGLVVSLGTGIGAGLVLDGEVYRGRSFAGEAGHMVLDPGGDRCACGGRGCWETLVSGEVLDREAARLAGMGTLVAELAGGRPPGTSHLVAAAARGDPEARRVLDAAGRHLGAGIANLIVVLDPEIVVVGGAVSAAGEMLLAPAREAIASGLSGGSVREPVPLVPSRFGAAAGAVGAALLARGVLPEKRDVDHERPDPTG